MVALKLKNNEVASTSNNSKPSINNAPKKDWKKIVGISAVVTISAAAFQAIRELGK